jgi:hypothetical protein
MDIDDNPELGFLTNLFINPVTDQERALRFKPGCSLMDQMQFEQWIVGQRRIRYFQEQLEQLEHQQQTLPATPRAYATRHYTIPKRIGIQ